jgi:archaellum biogenesis ATPase FlaH
MRIRKALRDCPRLGAPHSHARAIRSRVRVREFLSVSGSLSCPVGYFVIQGKSPFLPVSTYLIA